MNDTIGRVQAELGDLGYQTSTRESSQGMVVEFDYCVESGTRKGQKFRIGLSFQESGYPEYPPHWIHVSPPVRDTLGGVVQEYESDDGRKWIALSRPPSDIWDELPEKNMKSYLEGHLRRFWRQV